MVYDMNYHLATIIEEIRQDIRNKNINGLQTNKMFLQKAFKPLLTQIKQAETLHEQNQINTWKTFIKRLNTIISNQHSIDTIVEEATIANTQQIEQLDQHEWDFWETILSRTIQYNQEQYNKLLKEQQEEGP